MQPKHYCEGCLYYGGRYASSRCCNYCLITGKRRPCEAGEGCNVRRDGKGNGRKPMTIKAKKQESI